MLLRPLQTGCKISGMTRKTECPRETLRVSNRVFPWRIFTAFVAVLLVLTPTMLCAMPVASMNVAEHECCKHMLKADDCSKANMSSCCVTVPADTGLALTDLTKKSVSSPVEAEVATFNAFQALPVFSPSIETQTHGSPPHPDSAYLQILRI